MITCENCAHQTKVWHDDKRCKDGGYVIPAYKVYAILHKYIKENTDGQ